MILHVSCVSLIVSTVGVPPRDSSEDLINSTPPVIVPPVTVAVVPVSSSALYLLEADF